VGPGREPRTDKAAYFTQGSAATVIRRRLNVAELEPFLSWLVNGRVLSAGDEPSASLLVDALNALPGTETGRRFIERSAKVVICQDDSEEGTVVPMHMSPVQRLKRRGGQVRLSPEGVRILEESKEYYHTSSNSNTISALLRSADRHHQQRAISMDGRDTAAVVRSLWAEEAEEGDHALSPEPKRRQRRHNVSGESRPWGTTTVRTPRKYRKALRHRPSDGDDDDADDSEGRSDTDPGGTESGVRRDSGRLKVFEGDSCARYVHTDPVKLAEALEPYLRCPEGHPAELKCCSKQGALILRLVCAAPSGPAYSTVPTHCKYRADRPYVITFDKLPDDHCVFGKTRELVYTDEEGVQRKKSWTKPVSRGAAIQAAKCILANSTYPQYVMQFTGPGTNQEVLSKPEYLALGGALFAAATKLRLRHFVLIHRILLALGATQFGFDATFSQRRHAVFCSLVFMALQFQLITIAHVADRRVLKLKAEEIEFELGKEVLEEFEEHTKAGRLPEPEHLVSDQHVKLCPYTLSFAHRINKKLARCGVIIALEDGDLSPRQRAAVAQGAPRPFMTQSRALRIERSLGHSELVPRIRVLHPFEDLKVGAEVFFVPLCFVLLIYLCDLWHKQKKLKEKLRERAMHARFVTDADVTGWQRACLYLTDRFREIVKAARDGDELWDKWCEIPERMSKDIYSDKVREQVSYFVLGQKTCGAVLTNPFLTRELCQLYHVGFDVRSSIVESSNSFQHRNVLKLLFYGRTYIGRVHFTHMRWNVRQIFSQGLLECPSVMALELDESDVEECLTEDGIVTYLLRAVELLPNDA